MSSLMMAARSLAGVCILLAIAGCAPPRQSPHYAARTNADGFNAQGLAGRASNQSSHEGEQPPRPTGTPLDVVAGAAYAISSVDLATKALPSVVAALPEIAIELLPFLLRQARAVACTGDGPNATEPGARVTAALRADSARTARELVLEIDWSDLANPTTTPGALRPLAAPAKTKVVRITLRPRRDATSVQVTLETGMWLVCELDGFAFDLPEAERGAMNVVTVQVQAHVNSRGLWVQTDLPLAAVKTALAAERLRLRFGKTEQSFSPRASHLDVKLEEILSSG